jgi:hypothetical protein
LNAATATGGVFVLTPTAHQLAFRVSSRILAEGLPIDGLQRLSQRGLADRAIFTGSPNDYSISIDQLPRPSHRAAILINRFKQAEAVVYHCSNDCIVSPELIFNQDLFKFIEEDAGRKDLQAALNISKTLGVAQNETAKSDLYSFCKFTLSAPPR